MPDAIAKGMSANAFLRSLKVTTGGYTRTRFLRDWRNVAGTEAKKNVFKFVRRDRRPPMAALADVDWEMSQEYMYKVRAFVRSAPGEALEERFINIPSDRAMSPQEVEEAAFERWTDKEKYGDEVLERAQTVAGWRHVEEELETPSPFVARG
jgi:hypothetical protein